MQEGPSHFRARHLMQSPIPYLSLVPPLFYIAFLETSHVVGLHLSARGTGRPSMLSRTAPGVAQLASNYAVPAFPLAQSTVP